MTWTRSLLPLVLFSILALSACGDSATGPRAPGAIDLDALFLPATAAEMALVEAQWADRSSEARDVTEETSSLVLMGGGLGTVRVFSHTVDGNWHYGATLVPLGASAKSLPVVVFAHGGDEGVNVNDLALVLLLLGDRTRNYAFVIPSFRSERLTVGGSVFRSGGAPSPWDRDVDDALAFLDVALERTPEAAGRSAETRRMLERLDGLFDDYARRLAAPDDEALEVELQLLEQSLQEERARQRVRVR